MSPTDAKSFNRNLDRNGEYSSKAIKVIEFKYRWSWKWPFAQLKSAELLIAPNDLWVSVTEPCILKYLWRRYRHR